MQYSGEKKTLHYYFKNQFWSRSLPVLYLFIFIPWVKGNKISLLGVSCTYGRTDNEGDFSLKINIKIPPNYVFMKHMMLNGDEPGV